MPPQSPLYGLSPGSQEDLLEMGPSTRRVRESSVFDISEIPVPTASTTTKQKAKRNIQEVDELVQLRVKKLKMEIDHEQELHMLKKKNYELANMKMILEIKKLEEQTGCNVVYSVDDL